MATSPMGDFVHAPLKRGDGSTVLINRGWVPRSRGRGTSDGRDKAVFKFLEKKKIENRSLRI